MSTSTRVVKNTGFLYAKMGITMFVSLYTTRLVLNALGASDFGIFNIVGGSIALLGFINSSMAGATQRFMSYAEGAGDMDRQVSIFNVSTILHIMSGMFAVVVFIIAGYFFFNGILVIPQERIHAAIIVYCSLIISTFFTMITVPYEAVLNAHENMKYYAIVGILESFLKLAVAFVCVYIWLDKLIVYGILMALIPFCTLTIMRIYCHKNYKECIIAPKRFYNSSLMKKMSSFAGWNFLRSAASITTMQGMAILLNMFGGVIVNAAHSIAIQIEGQLLVFSHNMIKAINPVMVKSEGAGNTQGMLSVATLGNKFSFAFYAIFAIPFFVETPYILNLWLGHTPAWTVVFVRFVLCRRTLNQLTITLPTCIDATGIIKMYALLSSFIWIFPLIVGYLLYMRNFPIYTVYALLIIMEILLALVRIVFCHRLCGMDVTDYFLKTIFPSFLITGVVLFVLYSIHLNIDESFIRLLLIFAVGISLFVVTCFFVLFDNKDKETIMSFILDLKKKFIKN